MRLRLAFKLHGEEAGIARQIADAAGVDVDKLAKLAMQRYLSDVLDRATKMAEEAKRSGVAVPPTATPDQLDAVKEMVSQPYNQRPNHEGQPDADGQPSPADPVHSSGTLPPPSDPIPG